ncbi:DUF6000 family protein [Actinocorallia libanotica]|uniref:3-methyladenine DNA glycosylase AlkD n=1 Tax=Actinocorallia libanotica TaxID=46162 RepID=A0ABP4CG17_9ACTN
MSTSPDHDSVHAKALRQHVFGTPDDPVPDLMAENAKAIRRYVVWKRRRPRYLRLLGGIPERKDRFTAALIRDARKISDAELDRLLSCGWRPCLTAAWLIGIDRRQHYRERLGELLLESAGPYAGQGYCFALARFGRPEDAEILTAYLDRYLPRADCYYDQAWAMGALLYLDERLGTCYAERFLETGLWQSSAFSETEPADYHEMIASFCETVGDA